MFRDVLTHLASGAAGAILTILCQDWVARKRERDRDKRTRLTKAKDDFLETVATQRARLASVMDSNYRPFLKESQMALAEAVCKTEHVLPARQIACLQAVLEEYKREKPDAYGNTPMAVSDATVMRINTGFWPREQLQRFLDQFAACVKE